MWAENDCFKRNFRIHVLLILRSDLFLSITFPQSEWNKVFRFWKKLFLFLPIERRIVFVKQEQHSPFSKKLKASIKTIFCWASNFLWWMKPNTIKLYKEVESYHQWELSSICTFSYLIICELVFQAIYRYSRSSGTTLRFISGKINELPAIWVKQVRQKVRAQRRFHFEIQLFPLLF